MGLRFGFRVSVLLIGLSLFGHIPAAMADDPGEVIDFSIHQQYVSPRALGMGNAFVALADDYHALFYNPAGLARIEEAQVNLGLGALLDSKVNAFVNDINSTAGSGKVEDITDFLSKNYGNYYSARASLGGAWVRPNWGLAVIPLDFTVNMAIHQLAGAALDVIAYQDTTIAYGRGWDVKWFEQDRMSLGITGKFVYRAYLNKALLAADLAMDKEILRVSDMGEGFTADLDFGMLWTPKVSPDSLFTYFRPSFGFVARNILDYGFTSNFHLYDSKTSGEPEKLGRRFDIGSSWELPDFWVFKSRLLADLRDMGHKNFTFAKGSHLGMEFNWKMRSWWQGGWRIGLSQGYFTAGFTGKIGIFNLDLATYAEEVGPSDEPKASRRYVAKASLDW